MTPLVIDNIFKTFRQGNAPVTALAGVSLEVQRSQFLAIMGASGSGKSTLLHLMAGLTAPDSGRVSVTGEDLAKMNDRDLTVFRRRNIGLVFQSFNLIPTLTARQNLALPLLLEKRPQEQVAARVDELLRDLGMVQRQHHRPDALSGGEQQRIAIGRALACDPAVILADEPTGNLDSANSAAVCELLRDLSVVHGRTIVMVTHEPTVAAYAGEVVILRDGQLVERFATGQVDREEGLTMRFGSGSG
jgi:putative ABC transport system ATP-binding protein